MTLRPGAQYHRRLMKRNGQGRRATDVTACADSGAGGRVSIHMTNKELTQMLIKNGRRLALALFMAACVSVLIERGSAQKTTPSFAPAVPRVWPRVWPKVWDDREMADLE